VFKVAGGVRINHYRKEMQKKGENILGIQYLRGLAALGVVLCHYGSNLTSAPKLSAIFNFGQNGVSVFFLISGFIIVYSLTKSNYKPSQFFVFLLKRFIRIDPSYIATIILTLGFFTALSFVPSYHGKTMDFIPIQFIAHLLYFIPFTRYPFYNQVFWTLSVEFQFYILIGLLYYISDQKVYKTAFIVLFGLSCLIPLPNSYYLIFTYAPIFCLGISLIELYKSRVSVNLLLPCFLLILIFYKFGAAIFVLLTISSFVVFFLKIAIKPLEFLGNISYSLYLTHVLVLFAFAGIVKNHGIKTSSDPLFWLCIEVLLAILFAYLFYLFIERPSLRLSKRFFYNSKQSRTKDSSAKIHLNQE
jgi:exopolysaccharide production protein ExoZ